MINFNFKLIDLGLNNFHKISENNFIFYLNIIRNEASLPLFYLNSLYNFVCAIKK